MTPVWHAKGDVHYLDTRDPRADWTGIAAHRPELGEERPWTILDYGPPDHRLGEPVQIEGQRQFRRLTAAKRAAERYYRLRGQRTGANPTRQHEGNGTPTAVGYRRRS